MHCNGKCHLMKELAKAAEAEKPVSPNKKENAKQSLEELFFQEIPQLTSSRVLAHSSNAATSYCNLYSYQFDSAVFHPPTV